MSPVVRPATMNDLARFYGEKPKRTMRAWVMILGDEIIGVGGVKYPGGMHQPFLFSDIKPEAKQYPMAMVKGALQGLKALGAARILAIASPEEPNSIKLLTLLGFKHFATSTDGLVFQYRPSDRRAA